MIPNDQMDEIKVLRLTLHGRRIGYLAGFHSLYQHGGRNILSFADEFKNDPSRPTFSLTTHPSFPNSEKLMSELWAKNQRLHQFYLIYSQKVF